MKAHYLAQPLSHQPVASEALFGSTSRGDADSLSDRDYLIADENVQSLKTRYAALKTSGLSIASYTYRRLGALSQNGALFIQHLKQDAIVIRDKKNSLSQILRDFRPRTSYRDELLQNRNLAALCAYPPKTPRGMLWAADVAFVAFRNYAILTLAERGIYEFSFDRLLDQLNHLGEINARHRGAVQKLRKLKYQYRGDTRSGVDDPSELEEILQVLPSGHFPRKVCPIDVERILTLAPARQSNVSAYCHLRNVERWLIAVASLVPSMPAAEAFTRMEKYIRDPRHYAYSIGAETDAIVREIQKQLVEARKDTSFSPNHSLGLTLQ